MVKNGVFYPEVKPTTTIEHSSIGKKHGAQIIAILYIVLMTGITTLAHAP